MKLQATNVRTARNTDAECHLRVSIQCGWSLMQLLPNQMYAVVAVPGDGGASVVTHRAHRAEQPVDNGLLLYE